MLFLLLTILCSTSIALIIKHNDAKEGAPILLLAGNYLIASTISLIVLILHRNPAFSIPTLIFGALLALCFVYTFFAFAKAVSIAGTALATVSSRLSVFIPIGLSIIIFQESPNLLQMFGFGFTLITIILFYFSLKSHAGKRHSIIEYAYLFIVLLGIGINDFGMKLFYQWRPATEKPFFLYSLFTLCFIYTSVFILIKKIKFNKDTFLRGTVLGVPNMFSSFFILSAIARLPAIIVYPTVNIGIIILTAIAAALIWSEKLNPYGRWALAAGLTAILLLSL